MRAVTPIDEEAAEAKAPPADLDQNSMARMRTLLAAERTFLAWIRTGLSVIAGGLVIVKFVPFRNPDHEWVAHLLGQLLVIWGCATLLIAFFHYRRVANRLHGDLTGQTPLYVFVLLTTALVVVGVLVLWLTL